MSIAIANTQNNLGMRTLAAYNPRFVRRGPAEPGPRSAENPVVLGAIPMMPNFLVARSGIDSGYQDPILYGRPVNSSGPVFASGFGPAPAPVSTPVQATPPTLNANGTASQSPTGSIVNAALPLHELGVPSIATQISPATTPTATATIAPASQPGYVVITSGGGTTANQTPASPDYFAELEAWLTSNSLISAVPNWVPVVGVAVLLGFVWRGGKRR